MNFLYPVMAELTYYWGYKKSSFDLLQKKEQELQTVHLLKELI
jgi:hypothetical protein